MALGFGTDRAPKYNPNGQVLIAVLLVVVVAAAIAITVGTRTATEQKVATTVDESARALSLAEAGVEDAYRKIASGNIPSGDITLDQTAFPTTAGFQGNANYQIQSFGGDSKAFISPTGISQGETFQVLLSNPTASSQIDCSGSYPSNGRINVAFGDSGATNVPALEAVVVYKQGNSFKNARYVLDPSSSPRFPTRVAGPSSNNYSIPSDRNNLGATVSFSYLYSLAFSGLNPGDNLCLVRFRTLFNSDKSHHIAVEPVGTNLPQQGYKIVSTGNSTGSDTSRKLVVDTTFPALPGIGDYALFSASGQIGQ